MLKRKSKVTLTLNKLAYVGICILGVSKVLMYNFHIDYIKNRYGNNSRLFLTDTGSMKYEILIKITEDVDEDFTKNKKKFDFRNYSLKSKYYDDSKKLVVVVKWKKKQLD